MDVERRALERLAARGDREAEVALLRSRLRAGDLTEDQLRLAAHLGHQAAGAAVGVSGAIRDHTGPDSLFDSIKGCAKEVVVRVGVAACRLFDDSGWSRDALRSLEAAESWAADPVEERRIAAGRVSGSTPAYSDPSTAAKCVAQAAATKADGPYWRPILAVLRRAEQTHGFERVLENVRGEVLPWCLGQRDLVASRAEATRSRDERWARVKARCPLATRVRGTVTALAPFGAFLDLGDGGIGLVKVSESPAWRGSGSPPEVGSSVEGTVFHFDEHNRQVLLTLRS